MISLKPYLEAKTPPAKAEWRGAEGELLRAAVVAFSEAILAMVTSGRDACSATADQLEAELGAVADQIEEEAEVARLRASGETVALSLRKWGQNSAAHYREKTGEVKQMLLLMARAADSVGTGHNAALEN